MIVDKFLEVFKNYNVKLLLPSHSSYIQYGISVRIATKNKVPVIFLYKKGLSGKKIYFLKKDDDQVYDVFLATLEYEPVFDEIIEIPTHDT